MFSKASHKKSILLDDKIVQLTQTSAYPDNPSRINAIETHMSWVFLTDNFAYKLKKPVHYEFLDFTSLDARQYHCQEEMRLNRRLAPDVYLGVVPLTIDNTGKMGIERRGETIDWLVKMRRLPADRMLDFMITHKTLREPDIRCVADLLAAFYKRCQPVEITARQYRLAYERQVNTTFKALTEPRYELPKSQLKYIQDVLLDFIRCEEELLDKRVEQRRIVEGHGDLRPEHVCLETVPVIFDCLEFNYLFRVIDVLDEMSFLAMECDLLGAPDVGPIIFDIYGRLCDDHPPQHLINFYKTYRACLRAKLSIWHITELDPSGWGPWCERASIYLQGAEQYVRQLS